MSLSTSLVFWDDGPSRLAVTETSGELGTPDTSIAIYQSTGCRIHLYTDRHKHRNALRAGRKRVNNSNWPRWNWCSGKCTLGRQNSFPSVMIKEPGVAYWLRHCATSRTVPGSIPGGVTGQIPSDRSMALGSTQPLVKMSTRNISWG